MLPLVTSEMLQVQRRGKAGIVELGSIDIYRYNGTFAILVRNTRGQVEAWKAKSAQAALQLIKFFQGLFCKIAGNSTDRYLDLLLSVN